MKFLIERAMLYEVDTGMIMINGEEESSVKLSNQAARLLYVLIINNGQTLYRDDLIKKVWEEHGFSGSSVSLNVAISEIRKAFRMLGSDPLLIKTVRGKGFCLSSHIEHHTIRPPVSLSAMEQIRVDESNILTPRRDSAPPATEWFRLLRSTFITLCTLMSVVLVGFAVYLFINKKICTGKEQGSDIHVLGKVEQCTVYLIDKNMYHSEQVYFNRVKEIIERQHIDCEHQIADAYYSKFEKSLVENYFLAVCYQQGRADDYKNCVSYRSLTGS